MHCFLNIRLNILNRGILVFEINLKCFSCLRCLSYWVCFVVRVDLGQPNNALSCTLSHNFLHLHQQPEIAAFLV